jgi:hypothetical protein
MGMSIDTPFIAHSELTDEIYVIDKKAKYCVTDQVMKAVVDTNRAIPKADYENRLKADLVAMLTELKNELIDKSWNIDMYDDNLDFECCYLNDIYEIIQQKINELKSESEDKDGNNN